MPLFFTIPTASRTNSRNRRRTKLDCRFSGFEAAMEEVGRSKGAHKTIDLTAKTR